MFAQNSVHVEHVVPQSRGGHSQLDNLLWACPNCNLHKANHVEALNPDTGKQVPLFHPRSDNWEMHFRWEGYYLVGQTPVGRATVATPHLSHLRCIQIRQVEELFALFPPRDLSA